MTAEVRRNLAYGATVVAAILWFTAFVALFRRDLGDPLIAAAIFAGLGGAAALAGFIVGRGGR